MERRSMGGRSTSMKPVRNPNVHLGVASVGGTAGKHTSMPFDQHIPRPFTPAVVRAYAPRAAGIYGISNAREWIYIGAADDIQAALLGHIAEFDTSLMQRR